MYIKITILSALQSSIGKSTFNLANACFLMAIQHLLSPSSKLGSYQAQHRYACLPTVGLNHLYRSLDILSEGKEVIESHLFKMNRDLFNMKVDVVFYDVTTFHFESVQQDSLRDFGFSKNAKFNEVQVVLGMLVDFEGRPVGYELFPGNTFEGKTLDSSEKDFSVEKILDVLRTLWRIEESFRIMKSTLEVRPIFHWTESQIKGHFVVCFLAFLLERTLEIKLRNAEIQASPDSIRAALNSMQLAELEFQNEKILIKTKSEDLASKILRCLKIQPLKNMLPSRELRF